MPIYECKTDKDIWNFAVPIESNDAANAEAEYRELQKLSSERVVEVRRAPRLDGPPQGIRCKCGGYPACNWRGGKVAVFCNQCGLSTKLLPHKSFAELHWNCIQEATEEFMGWVFRKGESPFIVE